MPDQFEGAVNPGLTLKPDDLLGRPLTADYVPQAVSAVTTYIGLMNRNRPPFTYYTIRDMLCDPRVIFGLLLLKGPVVSRPIYQVECNDSRVGEFITKNLEIFWNVAAERVMKALEWGFSASEVLYEYNSEDGLIYFANVRDMESLDCRPVVLSGNIIGFQYRQGSDPWGNMNISGKSDESAASSSNNEWRYVGAPKALWHLHWPSRNPWFGLSRLFGAHVPWYEMWSEDGFRQIRRLWFTSCAFDGGTMYHPSGMIATPQGQKPARDYAREMIEKKRTGSVLTLPNTVAGDGNARAWEYIPPEGQPTPAGLLEYGEDLRSEVFEALGIPPEVIQSGGETGFGSSSGRQVPQDAYNSILHSLSTQLLLDFNRFVLRYLVNVQFGPVQYRVFCTPLDEMSPQQQQQPPGEGEEVSPEEGEEGGESNDQSPPEKTGE